MEEGKKGFVRKPNRPFPLHTLEEALVIAIAIQENNAGKPMKRLLLADAIGRKPSTVQFRDLLSSAYKYGITLGTEKAEHIELTQLGKNITKPTSSQQEIEAKQKSVLTPEKFNEIYSHYKDAKFPGGSFFENTLEVQFKIPREYTNEVIGMLEKNGKFSGIIRDISGSPHVMFDNFTTVQGGSVEVEDENENPSLSTQAQRLSQKPRFL